MALGCCPGLKSQVKFFPSLLEHTVTADSLLTFLIRNKIDGFRRAPLLPRLQGYFAEAFSTLSSSVLSPQLAAFYLFYSNISDVLSISLMQKLPDVKAGSRSKDMIVSNVVYVYILEPNLFSLSY